MKTNENGSLTFDGKFGIALAWGDLWEFVDAEEKGGDPDLTYADMAEFAAFKAEFTGPERFLENEDFGNYGANRFQVIQRRATGECFGLAYYEGLGKHGETIVEEDDDSEGEYTFVPVEAYPITAFRVKGETSEIPETDSE